MNRVYKTVWNKVRRALMVVNEATSCCQGGQRAIIKQN